MWRAFVCQNFLILMLLLRLILIVNSQLIFYIIVNLVYISTSV